MLYQLTGSAANQVARIGNSVCPQVAEAVVLRLAPDNTATVTLDACVRTLLRLGVETQSANRQVDVQGSIVEQVDQSRDGASGVNLDDEMAEMVSIQHAYEEFRLPRTDP